MTLIAQYLCFGLACAAWRFLAAYGGMFSFGHAIFTGIGAYAAIWAMRALGDAPALWLMVLPFASVAAGAVAGAAVGVLTARARGTAFAMITFGLGELVQLSAQAWTDLFGGESGLGADRGLGGLANGISPFVDDAPLLGLLLGWVVLAQGALVIVARGGIGRSMRLVRDHAERAQALGLNPAVVRWQANLISGAAAALAGGLLALLQELSAPEAFEAERSIALMLAAVIGGLRSAWGPWIGSAVYVVLAQWLAVYVPAWAWWLGAMFVVIMWWRPDGLWTRGADA